MARTPFDGLAPEIVAMILVEVDFADSTSLLSLACTSEATFTAIAPRLFKTVRLWLHEESEAHISAQANQLI
jgi:hypothetical protein